MTAYYNYYENNFAFVKSCQNEVVTLREKVRIMKNYSTFQERNKFEEKIFEVVQEYIDDEISFRMERGNFAGNVGLCVNPKTLELVIEGRGKVRPDWDFYPMERFIRPTNDNAGDEPDCDATHELASSYCFIK